jgi:hypothetical protein
MQIDLWQVLQGLLAPFALAVEALAVAQSEWWRRIAETVQDTQGYIAEALTQSSRRTGRLTVVSIHADRMRALRELSEKRKLAEILLRSNNIGKGMEALYRDLHIVFGVITGGTILIILYLVVSFFLGIPMDLQATGEWLLVVCHLVWLVVLLLFGAVILSMLVFHLSRMWWIIGLLLLGVSVVVIVVLQFIHPFGLPFVSRLWFIFWLSLGEFVLCWFCLTQFYIGAITLRLHNLKRDADKLRDEMELRLQSVPSIFS